MYHNKGASKNQYIFLKSEQCSDFYGNFAVQISVTGVCIFLVSDVGISGWVGGSQEIRTLFGFKKYILIFGRSRTRAILATDTCLSTVGP